MFSAQVTLTTQGQNTTLRWQSWEPANHCAMCVLTLSSVVEEVIHVVKVVNVRGLKESLGDGLSHVLFLYGYKRTQMP